MGKKDQEPDDLGLALTRFGKAALAKGIRDAIALLESEKFQSQATVPREKFLLGFIIFGLRRDLEELME